PRYAPTRPVRPGLLAALATHIEESGYGERLWRLANGASVLPGPVIQKLTKGLRQLLVSRRVQVEHLNALPQGLDCVDWKLRADLPQPLLIVLACRAC